MNGALEVLVTSSELGNRRALIQVLEALSANVTSSSSIQQASEVLSKRPIELVFCDDQLSDGSYRDLLPAARIRQGQSVRVVVTTRTGEWEEYLEAMRLGAFDFIRGPMHPTDVELVVLRAQHEQDERAA
jgi:DNA-binding NtrC family response regulator